MGCFHDTLCRINNCFFREEKYLLFMKHDKIYVELQNVNLYYSAMSFKNRSLKSSLFSFFRQAQKYTDIHALKNVSATIKKGERVALLGRNGAGKSTFLKMLAGLYPIHSGTRFVQGEIRPMLELSLGFESEATGRENILYRGLMLGLSPNVINKQVEEIIAFSDLGEYIDYPIKTYSTGMLVRLAFAITTSLHGDILLIDEIIGAGDYAFMQKAKKRVVKIVEKAQILFLATHDLGAAKEFCNRGILLEKGIILYDGAIDDAVDAYRKNLESANA